jgi:hypothetical protein
MRTFCIHTLGKLKQTCIVRCCISALRYITLWRNSICSLRVYTQSQVLTIKTINNKSITKCNNKILEGLQKILVIVKNRIKRIFLVAKYFAVHLLMIDVH